MFRLCRAAKVPSEEKAEPVIGTISGWACVTARIVGPDAAREEAMRARPNYRNRCMEIRGQGTIAYGPAQVSSPLIVSEGFHKMRDGWANMKRIGA